MPKFSLPGKREVITTTNFFSNLCTGLRYNNLYSTLTPSESDTSSAPAGQSCAVRSFVLQPRPWQHCPTRSRAAHLRRLHRTSCSWRGSQTSPCTHATADSWFWCEFTSVLKGFRATGLGEPAFRSLKMLFHFGVWTESILFGLTWNLFWAVEGLRRIWDTAFLAETKHPNFPPPSQDKENVLILFNTPKKIKANTTKTRKRLPFFSPPVF